MIYLIISMDIHTYLVIFRKQVPVHKHMCTSVCIYFYTLYADGKTKVSSQCPKKKPQTEEMGPGYYPVRDLCSLFLQ